MTRVNDRFSFDRDSNGCWTLYDTQPTTGPKAKNETRTRQSYYGRLEHVCDEIIDREAGSAETIAGIIDAIWRVRAELAAAIAELTEAAA